MGTKEVRVLYMVSSLRRCGPINQLYGLVKNLDKRTFKARILTLSKEKKDSMLEAFLLLGAEVVSAGLSSVSAHIIGKKTIRKAIRDFNPDIIHSSGIRPDYYAEKWRDGSLHCATIREYAYDDYPVEYGNLKGNLMAAFHIGLLSKLAYPVCCSHAIAQRLEAAHGLKTEVIQNGVDDERYFHNQAAGGRAELRKKLGLPAGKRIYVYSGLLIDRKDPVTLIRAFVNSGIHEKAVLVILGEGPLAQTCSFEGNEAVLLKGHVKNVPEYLQAGDVFVSASKSEGLPNSVLEAMSTGLPVLLSDIGPHRELLGFDRGAGEVFQTGDIDNLSEKFVQSLSWDVNAMGGRACNTVREHFSAGIMSRGYQQLYLKMLEGGAGA